MRRLSFLLLLLLALPTLANTPAAVSGNCDSTNTCAFSTAGGLVNPAAGQLMVFFGIGPSGNNAPTNINDTYGGSNACSGSPLVCGAWKAVSASPGLWSNSNLGIVNANMVIFLAKTGTNSGAESLTVTWNGGGTAIHLGLASFNSTDVLVSATNVEDTSVFRQDTNINSCTLPDYVTGSFTTTINNDVVMTYIGQNETFDQANNPSASGLSQQAIAQTNSRMNLNSTGWNGVSATLTGNTIGTYSTTFNHASCTATAGNAGLFVVVLKGNGGGARLHRRVNLIRERALNPFELFHTLLLRNWKRLVGVGRA